MNVERIVDIRRFLSDKLVQISVIILIFSFITVSYFFSVLAGLLIITCYFTGIWFSSSVWIKLSFSLASFISLPTFKPSFIYQPSLGCNVCGDSSCKRQKPVKDNQPWLGLNVPKEVDQAIQDLLNKILNELVSSWYKSLSKDETFLHELRHNLRYATSILLRRTLQVDIADLITERLITTGFSHVHDFQSIRELAKVNGIALETAAVQHLGVRMHSAVRNRATELSYLRGLCESLSPYLLQSNDLECSNFKILMRELLAGWVLLPLSDTLCDPFCINSLLLLAVSPEPLTHYPESPSMQVQFLQRFVASTKDTTAKKSALQCDLSTIFKSQDLLYTFMQFLKKQSAVHILQFCLDVEEFNRRMLSPELTHSDIQNLRREAEDLFSVYFKADSPDFIHCSPHIAQLMEQVLKSGDDCITRLRTSTPLFQAYEVAYLSLEESYCPLFFQSDEYFVKLCGDRFPSKYVKHGVSSHMPPGSPIRGRTNKRGDSSAVSKLSNKFHKLLQFQAVEGSVFYTDTPLDIPDTECTEELQIGNQSHSSYKDMSAWRVTIPRVTTRQDPNSKPYPLFIINVIDIGPKDCGDRGSACWEVQRRYNDFYTLQAKLTEFHGEFEGGQLPGRRGMFAPRGAEFMESRRQLFEQYLQNLLSRPQLRGSNLLHSFLNANAEFSSVLSTPAGLGVILRRSVEPIKLRKEKGRHLENFLVTFQASTEGSTRSGQFEWQDVNVESLRHKRNIKQSMFRDNFKEALDECQKVETVPSEGFIFSGAWDCILYVLSQLMGASSLVLQAVITIRNLLGPSPGDIIKHFINNKLRTLLIPPRTSHLVRLLQGALFNSSYQPGKMQRNANHLREQVSKEFRGFSKQPLPRWLLPNCDNGLDTILETLQHPILNKQLCYCLLDEIVRVLFPEIVTSG